VASEEKDAALSVTAGTGGVATTISNFTLVKIGSLFSWLFPKKDAQVVIMQAQSQRIAAKIQNGQELSKDEKRFKQKLFGKR
jgi:hypothetical protein